MSTPSPHDPAWQAALSSSINVLRRVANGTIPPELDRRYLDLGKRKIELTAEDRAELVAWVAFMQARSAELLEAELALKRLTTVVSSKDEASGAA